MNIAVIDLGFGDAGKGSVVAALSGEDDCVVRFNGGAQAGHRVVCGETEHVFRQFGSGTLNGASTYYSEHCFFDIEHFEFEHEEIGGGRFILSDRSNFITPLHTLVNYYRCNHDSCGYGIFEAFLCKNNLVGIDWVKVSESPQSVYDQVTFMRYFLENQNTEWSERALQALDHYVVSEIDLSRYSGLIGKLPAADRYIFEGAQGNLIGMQKGERFNTPSYTDFRNADDLACQYGLKTPYRLGITRCYSVRHGRGPMPYEDLKSEIPLNSVDPTNPTNPFQGPIRYGWLDFERLVQSYRETFCDGLGINCLDQLEEYPIVISDQKIWMKESQLIDICTEYGMKVVMLGRHQEEKEFDPIAKW